MPKRQLLQLLLPGDSCSEFRKLEGGRPPSGGIQTKERPRNAQHYDDPVFNMPLCRAQCIMYHVSKSRSVPRAVYLHILSYGYLTTTRRAIEKGVPPSNQLATRSQDRASQLTACPVDFFVSFNRMTILRPDLESFLNRPHWFK